MTKQITLEEALKLVSFYHLRGRGWQVLGVNGNIDGDVDGNVFGNVNGYIYGNVDGVKGDVRGYVKGDVDGDVFGYIYGNIKGNVLGTINGQRWDFVETPKEKLQRLIEESGIQELIDTFNQMENN